MFSLLLLLTVQCAQAIPEADYLVEVEVKMAAEAARNQSGVQGAKILLNAIEMGKTGTDGRFVGMIRGQAGQEVELDVVPPEGYVLSPDFTKPVVTLETETNDAGRVRGKSLDFSITVFKDSYEYMIMVSGTEPNRPVFAGDEELASTDNAGTAMVLLPGKAGDTVHVKVMTSGPGQQLLGKTFQLPDSNSVLMITENDVVQDDSAPTVADATSPAAKTGRAPLQPGGSNLPDEYNPSQFSGKATGQKVTAADLMAAEDAAGEAGKAAREAQQASKEVEQVLAGAAQGAAGYSELKRSAGRASSAATQAQKSARNATRAARNGDAAMAKAYAQAASASAAKAADEISIASRLLATISDAPSGKQGTTPAYQDDSSTYGAGGGDDDDNILATANQLVKDAMLTARKASSTTREVTTMIRKAKNASSPELKRATTEANQIRSKATAASQSANRVLVDMRKRGASARTHDNLDKIEGFKGDVDMALMDADSLKDRVTAILDNKSPDQKTASTGGIKAVELGVCDLEKLTSSVDNDLVPAYLVAACEAITEGHPEYSDANFQLARHYRRNREHKKEQRALQRATGYGRYRHDPSVLFQLIKVSITNHDYQTALSVQDRFLLTNDRLPSSQRMKMVAEMYELFAKAYEFQFYQKHEANPEGNNLDLLDKAIEMWEHFKTYTEDAAKGNREISKLRQLREEVSK